MILIVGVMSLCCWFALPLVSYIRQVESGERCQQCDVLATCFARRPFGSDGNMVDCWMFISYLMVRKQCADVPRVFLWKKLFCIIVSLVLALVLFWSKGADGVGALFGVSAIALFFLSVVDWNTQYIPLEMNGIIFFCGLIHLFADFSNWFDYAIGLIAVSGFLFLIDWLMTPVLKKKHPEEEIDSVIGDGDVKLMAATGLLIGWKLNFLALGIGCILGSIIHVIRMKIKGSGSVLALGPYLSLGVYITMICGEQLISWYLNMLGVYPY